MQPIWDAEKAAAAAKANRENMVGVSNKNFCSVGLLNIFLITYEIKILVFISGKQIWDILVQLWFCWEVEFGWYVGGFD